MSKRYLNGFYPYLINGCEDGYYLTDGNGLMLTSEEIFDIGTKLIKFSKLHNEDILQYNKKRQDELNCQMSNWKSTPKEKPKGHIYIMECGGKYKIGVSKDIERRRKQLDNKPFPVTIIYKSPLIKNVYDIEKEIHSVYDEKRIAGEWFELNNNDIEAIKIYVEE